MNFWFLIQFTLGGLTKNQHSRIRYEHMAYVKELLFLSRIWLFCSKGWSPTRVLGKVSIMFRKVGNVATNHFITDLNHQRKKIFKFSELPSFSLSILVSIWNVAWILSSMWDKHLVIHLFLVWVAPLIMMLTRQWCAFPDFL